MPRGDKSFDLGCDKTFPEINPELHTSRNVTYSILSVNKPHYRMNDKIFP